MNYRDWITKSNSAAELRAALELADQMTGRPRAAAHLALIALSEILYQEVKELEGKDDDTV